MRTILFFTRLNAGKSVFAHFLSVGVIVVLAQASQSYAGIAAGVSLQMGQPGNILPGEVTFLEITLSNNSDLADINDVAFNKPLPGLAPDSLKVAGAPVFTCFDPQDGPNGTTSTPVPSPVTAALGGQSVELSGAVIPPRGDFTDPVDNLLKTIDGSCTLLLPVTAGTSTGDFAAYEYGFEDGDVTGDDGNPVENAGGVSQSINVLGLQQPTIRKSFSNGVAILGGAPRTLRITVENPNATVAIENFSISDTFPADGGGAIIQVVNPLGATTECVGVGGVAPGFVGLSAGDVAVSVSGGTVAAGGSCDIILQVEARQSDVGYQTANLNNTIDAETQFSNDIGISAESNATARIRARSPLNVNKSFSPAQLADGETGEMTINWINSGTTPLVVEDFTDSPIDSITHAVMTQGLRVVDGSPIVVNCPGGGTAGTFIATPNNEGIRQTTDTTIAAGERCTITTQILGQIGADSNTPISYTNNIGAGDVDVGNAAIVSRSTSASILVSDTLRVQKALLTANPRPGNPLLYRVTVDNWSSAALDDVRILDDLTPNNMTFLTGTLGGNDYSPDLTTPLCAPLNVTGATGDTMPTFTFDTVPARANASTPGRCIVEFYVMTDPNAPVGSSTANSLPAGSVCTENGGGFCNGGGATSGNSPVVVGVLEVAKSFTPVGPLPEGSITRLRIELSNFSVNPVIDLTVSDTLPISGGVQMRVASPPNLANTCGGTLVAVADSTSVAIQDDGTVPARADQGAGAAGSCVIEVDVVGAAGAYTNEVSASGRETYANDDPPVLIVPVDDTAPFTFTSILSSIKSFNPATVSSGGTSTVTVEMDNSGPDPLTNVAVSDMLPPGMFLASPVNAYTTCDGTTTITGNPGDGAISLSGATVAGGGSCGFIFDVTATGAADWVNTIPAGGIEAVGSGVVNQAPVTATLVFSAGTSPVVSKITNPNTLTFPGQSSRMTVTLTNFDQAITNLALEDFFTMDGTSGSPANGMILTSSPGATTDCVGGVVSAVPEGDSMGVSGVSLGVGEMCSFSANVTSTTIGGITNVVPIGAISTSEGLTNGTAATTSLTTQTSLGILKTFTPNVIQPGARSRLRLTFINPTPTLASSLAVIDTMPAGVTIAPGPNPVTTCAGATITIPSDTQVEVTGGILAAATNFTPASCYAEIDVTASAEGAYLNEIPAGDLTAIIGGMLTANIDPASDTLRVSLPVVINKAIANRTEDVPPAIFTTGTAVRSPGVNAPLTILLTNPNTIALTEATLVDDLPVGLVIANVPGAATTCAGGLVDASALGTSVTLTGATLPASGSCTVTVNVVSNIPGNYLNTIPGGALTTLEGVSNEESTNARVFVSSPPTIGKQFSPAVIPPNGISRLTLVVGNPNDSDITLTANFVDTLPTLPGAVLVAAVPNVVTSCVGAVTAAAGSPTVTLGNGATIPAGGCDIQVDVTAVEPGQHNNNIPVGDLQTNAGENQLPANAPLIVSTEGFISGSVFEDNNVVPDGLLDTVGDTPISGVTINLYASASCSGAILDTVSTDAQGNYLFFGLPAGTYSVCQPSQPVGTINGDTTAGGIVGVLGSTGVSGTQDNPTTTSSQVTAIVLNGNGTDGAISGSPDNNFAEIVSSSISGQVFLDDNNSGIFNGPDVGLAGQLIELLDSAGDVFDTTTTDAQGNYSFTDLVPATYSVRQPNQPANTSGGITTPGAVDNGGSSGSATAPAVVPSQISTIVLPPNTASSANNFAEISNGRVISGRVFFDFNDSGSLDGTDYGLAGQIIELTGTDINGNPVPARQLTTAADGSYSFVGLPEGTYTVTQPNQPADTSNGETLVGTTGGTATDKLVSPSAISAIDLTGSDISAENNFAEVPDVAPDLVITKEHTPSSFGVGSSTSYFTLTPGNIGAVDTVGAVTVSDPLPAGMTLAATPSGAGWICSGGAGATNFSCTTSDVVPSGGVGSPITVQVAIAAGIAGQVLTNTATVSGGGEPAGFTGNNSDDDTVAIGGVASVSGKVWSDPNLDSILTGDERGLSRWIVELFLGGVLVDTTRTNGAGDYQFDNLSPASGYDIVFRDPVNGNPFGTAVTNEQGLASADGVRDNTGNPAGASVPATGLTGLTLLDGDAIVGQSLPLNPDVIPVDTSLGIPVMPVWALLLLVAIMLVFGVASLGNAGFRRFEVLR